MALLRWATDYFSARGVSEPRASAEVLLAHVLGVSRLDLYLRHDQPLTPEELARFKALLLRRRRGEPVAYLTGHKEFWSRDFLVSPATLIPRPETELLVETALRLAKEIQGTMPPPYRGLELGVGCGAVAVTLAKELPTWEWLAGDISGPALKVAQENARRHEVAEKVALFQGDLLEPLLPRPHFVLIVANLPYVPRAAWENLPPEIRLYEPPEALLGGEDGLDLIRRLIAQAPPYLRPQGWLTLEVGRGQAKTVLELLELTKAFEKPDHLRDYQGIPRVVLARRRTAP